MGSLEKIFLGCMALFGGFILFLFSLYFDLGDIFGGAFYKRSAATSVSGMESGVEQARRAAVREEVMPVAGPAVPIAPGQNLPVEKLAAMYVVQPKQLTEDELEERERRRLTRLGYKSEPYVRLQLLAVRRQALDEVKRRLETLEAAKDWDGAVSLIQATIDETDPANLVVLHELYVLLREVELVRQNVAGAEAATAKAFEIVQAIKNIELNEPKFREDAEKARKLQEENEELQKQYGQAQEAFRQMKEHQASGRDLRRFSASEVAKAKLDIMQSFERGEIDGEERDDALAALEEIVRKGL